MGHGYGCAKKGGKKWLGLGRCEGPADLLRRGKKMQRNSQGALRLIGACILYMHVLRYIAVINVFVIHSCTYLCVRNLMCHFQKFDCIAILGACHDSIERDVYVYVYIYIIVIIDNNDDNNDGNNNNTSNNNNNSNSTSSTSSSSSSNNNNNNISMSYVYIYICIPCVGWMTISRETLFWS